jgi:hypothetical protein
LAICKNGTGNDVIVTPGFLPVVFSEAAVHKIAGKMPALRLHFRRLRARLPGFTDCDECANIFLGNGFAALSTEIAGKMPAPRIHSW